VSKIHAPNSDYSSFENINPTAELRIKEIKEFFKYDYWLLNLIVLNPLYWPS